MGHARHVSSSKPVDEYAPGRHADVETHSSLVHAPAVALPCVVAHPKGQRVHAVLPVAFEYQLRGQTVQGVTPVGEDDPSGHCGLHDGEAVAVVSVDVPGGQGVHVREALEEEYQPLGQGEQGSRPTAEYDPG